MIGYARPAFTLEFEAPLELARLSRLAPRPTTIAETGLATPLLLDLTLKLLGNFGVMSLAELNARLGLPGVIVEQLLLNLRTEALVEVRSRLGIEGELRYGLTDRGRAAGHDSLSRGGYLGPAPVPLDDYSDLVAGQSIRRRRIERDVLSKAIGVTSIAADLLDQLGPALNSNRATLLYGQPGTGKTYISQKLARVLPDLVLVPFAIAVNDTIIQVFDPQVHVQVAMHGQAQSTQLAHGWDLRYACCERPVVTAAGELTLDMLEVQRDIVARTWSAPLQLKANNGVFLIDDLGRQRTSARALFDRWIVPMEEGRDFLSAGSGQHFAVPFDQMLIFSTNLDPREIADEAFLRRIGYKIEFKPCTTAQFGEIWRGVCKDRNVFYDAGVLMHVLTKHYGQSGEPLLPCHPRDLIAMAINWKVYQGMPNELDETALDWAWRNYFVHPAATGGSAAPRTQP
ncbi:MAG: AAA family ATPase [Steroidobacteraceae bacterium]